jgi:multimeric flavodoxin WrbA
VFKDDMGQMLKKFIDADLIIFGTPLYYFTMTGLMKNFMDRLLPLALPFMEENENGVTTHPGRYSDKAKKMVLVSGCGFPEIKHFEALVATFKKISEAGEAEYLGEILRPAAGIMDLEVFQHQLNEYRHLLKDAGKQLITGNAIDAKTHEALHRVWISPNEFRESANQYFKSELEKIGNK